MVLTTVLKVFFSADILFRIQLYKIKQKILKIIRHTDVK